MFEYKTLPYRKFSYVVDENGEPLFVFYKKNQGLFTAIPSVNEECGYFLNIRHPISVDANGQKINSIPSIPDDCDGIIIENYAAIGVKAFIVKDFNTQTMQISI